MASVISTATTPAATTPLASTPTTVTVTLKSPSDKAEKKKAKKERKEKLEKLEKKKGKKREREPKRVSPKRPVESESSSDEDEEEEDIILVDEDDDEMLRKSPKNVEAEVQELLNGEEREKVIAMAKEHEKAERKLRQQAKDDLKKLTAADDKKLQALFVRQEALAKTADVALLKQLKTQKADLERRILDQEEKGDVISLKKVDKDIRAQRVEMRQKFGPIAKEKGLRYAVPNGIRKERAAKKTKKDSCCVCFDEEPNCDFCALAPCGHQNTCYRCAQKLSECPICRARITVRVKLIKN